MEGNRRKLKSRAAKMRQGRDGIGDEMNNQARGWKKRWEWKGREVTGKEKIRKGKERKSKERERKERKNKEGKA